MASELFTGTQSLRVRAERSRSIATVLALPLSLAALGFVFHNTFTLGGLVLIVVGALVLVALGRGRFLGGGVRIGPGHFGDAYTAVEQCSRLIGIATPHVFLRDDLYTPVVAIGTGEPYALAISAQWIELFSPAELRFAVGRELGHIAAGHAKITSLMSANGRENAFVSVAFGAWLRTIEYTADRIGLLCCGSMPVALSAIAVSTFQHAGRRVDVESFARQRRELEAEPALRMGEWLASTPYVTNRVARLTAFATDPLYLAWCRRFEDLRRQGTGAVRPHGERQPIFAGPLRRCLAFVIDATVVALLVPRPSSDAESRRVAASLAPAGYPVPAIAQHIEAIVHGIVASTAPFMLLVYVIVLVGLAGQTLGMMICDVRVVDVAEGPRSSLARAFTRYALGLLSFVTLIGFIAMLRRVQPFERWSRTRLVVGNALPKGR